MIYEKKEWHCNSAPWPAVRRFVSLFSILRMQNEKNEYKNETVQRHSQRPMATTAVTALRSVDETRKSE